MFRSLVARYLAVTIFLAGVGWSFQNCNGDLTRNQIEILESEFLPAWNVGNTLVVLESLNKAIRKMSDEQIAELDELLAGQNIPSSSQLLLESRLMLLRQNARQKLPRPGVQELLLTLEHIRGEVTLLIEDSQALLHALDQLTENATFTKFDSLLWDTHVMNQQLQSSMFMTEYAAKLLKTKKRYRVNDLNDNQKALLETDFGQFLEELKTARQDLGEHEIVARINRLQHARKTLGLPAADRKEQFLAAWSVNQDVDLILQALKAAGKNIEFKHAVLQDEDLPEAVRRIGSRGIELAGEELLTKSRLLFEGMHWWYRGRYGMGTDAFGILKSPAAVTSDEAAFALLMPIDTPVPTNPRETSRYQIPEIDRRHHYIWAWEYRVVRSHESTDQKIIDRSKRVTQVTGLSRFY